MSNRSTNFSYFLPRHVFNSVETMELYPRQTRPSDTELSVDKAMTMLNICEDQIQAMQRAEPFNPTSFGFEEKEVSNTSEFDGAVLYVSADGKYWISPGEKPMTWEITKLKLTDGEEKMDMMGNIQTEWEITAFIPNRIVGAIVLQSLDVIDLVNPEGVYDIPVVEETVEASPLDSSKPVFVFAPQNWQDPKDQDAFLLKHGIINEEGQQIRNAFMLSAGALEAMRQIRFVIADRTQNGTAFEGMEDAINEHPSFSPEQKEKMLAEWKEVPSGVEHGPEDGLLDVNEPENKVVINLKGDDRESTFENAAHDPSGLTQNEAAVAPVTEAPPAE